MGLTDLFVGFVGKEEVVAREGERGNVSEPFPADRHGGREPGVEGGHDPCRAACECVLRDQLYSGMVPAWVDRRERCLREGGKGKGRTGKSRSSRVVRAVRVPAARGGRLRA